jgi:hypothetical protein
MYFIAAVEPPGHRPDCMQSRRRTAIWVPVPRAPIVRFDNASDTEPVAFVACYLLPAGEDRLIEMLGPTS